MEIIEHGKPIRSTPVRAVAVCLRRAGRSGRQRNRRGNNDAQTVFKVGNEL